MATGSSLTQNYSRSQSEIQGDLHTMILTILVAFDTSLDQAGRIVRLRPERTALKIFHATPSNKRPKGRPKRRWKDCVNEGFAILKVKNWRSIAGRRAE
ncbi:hypothetical protein TNCV_114411 [Trichonephila clavipes]|nr:hypothetical protein TNCV_114411 [Trichonephila clavipes]